MKLFMLLLLCFPIHNTPPTTFTFSEDDTTFINQFYVCDGTSITARITSITLLQNDNVAISVATQDVCLVFYREDIKDFDVEFFGNKRVIFLKNGCEFIFEVTGTTPEPLREYFKDVYLGRK